MRQSKAKATDKSTKKLQESLQEKIEKFEEKNPDVAKAMKIFDISFDEYNSIINTLNPVITFTSNSTVVS